MLFVPAFFLQQPLQVLAVLAIIIIGKSLAAYGIVRLLRYPDEHRADHRGSPVPDWRILVYPRRAGNRARLASTRGQHLILAGALLSITLNPLVFRLHHRAAIRPSRLIA